ncbi:MAG: N-acetylneuraminate synthase family protein [Nitrospirota bacterium]
MPGLKKVVEIVDRKIGSGNPVFIIAEAGVNHFGNIEIAKHLIDMAVIARADAVKFQIFKTENLVSSVAPDWIERLKPKELPYNAFKYLKEFCDKKGIIFLASAHDEESLDFYSSLNPPAYKIGSGEVSNAGYLRKVAEFKKPVILSTGMYDMDDVRDAVDIFLSEGSNSLIILHCITCYPPAPEDINLRAINTLQKEFGCPVGYSDHTIGNDIVLAAVAIGASIIEKHIAVSRNAPGSQDCLVSCDDKGLIEMVNSIRKIEKAIGNGNKVPSEREMKSKDWARKSIVAKVDIKKDDLITRDMLTLKRPGTGISPKNILKVIGHRAKRTIKADSLLKFEDIIQGGK